MTTQEPTPESQEPEEKERRLPRGGITVGVSGLSHASWIGPVYPEGTPEEEYPVILAEKFHIPLVELSYPDSPGSAAIADLVEKAPAKLRFLVDLPDRLTRKIRDERGGYIRNEAVRDEFLAALSPMMEAGRLAALVARFGPKFTKSPEGMAHLEWLASLFPGGQLAADFGSASWHAVSTFMFLEERGIGWVNHDAPKGEGFPPLGQVATAPLGFFRLHGRNPAKGQDEKGRKLATRYSEFELRQLIEPVRRVAARRQETVVIFNNHPGGASLDNARAFARLLGVDPVAG